MYATFFNLSLLLSSISTIRMWTILFTLSFRSILRIHWRVNWNHRKKLFLSFSWISYKSKFECVIVNCTVFFVIDSFLSFNCKRKSNNPFWYWLILWFLFGPFCVPLNISFENIFLNLNHLNILVNEHFSNDNEKEILHRKCV